MSENQLRFRPEPEIVISAEGESEIEPLFQVLIHNDEVTPMDFVVELLKRLFYLSNPRAADIMLAAHFYGTAYVQSLIKSEAESRVNRAHAAAESMGYPLRFSIQPEQE